MVTDTGTAHCYGNNVNTDLIVFAGYLAITDIRRLARHAMETAGNADFLQKLQSPAGVAGDYIVAGDDFGSGSSREHAPAVLLENRVGAVIAKSFSRIFRRNAINVGFPLIECPEAVNSIKQGHEIEVVYDDGQRYGTGIIHNRTTGQSFHFQPLKGLSQLEKEIAAAGGGMQWAVKFAKQLEQAPKAP
ncbi:3-isopropylmalate dehydratase small subunit [Candidatus Woesearchaeota archaeon]|nr:3-isopropylmalate dehydratase small subunit [Candidatus Woesearchaeota archaeon]